MAHGRDKPGREKRKQKKDKSAGKQQPSSEVLQNIQHQPNETR